MRTALEDVSSLSYDHNKDVKENRMCRNLGGENEVSRSATGENEAAQKIKPALHRTLHRNLAPCNGTAGARLCADGDRKSSPPIEYSNVARNGNSNVMHEDISPTLSSAGMVLIYASSLRTILEQPFSSKPSLTLRAQLENTGVRCLSFVEARTTNIGQCDCVLLLDETSLAQSLWSRFYDGAALILLGESSATDESSVKDEASTTGEASMPELFARLCHNETIGSEALFHLARSGLRHSALQRQVALLERERQLQSAHLHQLNAASDEFSGERDRRALLQIILTHSRSITGADVSAFYLLQSDAQGESCLCFEMAQGDWRSSQDELKCDHLFPLGGSSLIAYVARTGETVCVADAYHLPQNAPFVFDAAFDQSNNYQTMSLMAVPLRTHDGEIFGVLQLLNCKRTVEPATLHSTKTNRSMKTTLSAKTNLSGDVLPFNGDAVELAVSLARQVAVAMENSSLHGSVEDLFDGFVTATARTIEQRDPVTSGHSERVAILSTELARSVSEAKTPLLGEVVFSAAQFKELHYAALLHDFGKIIVHEDVLLKCNKLHPQELEVLRMRFDLVRALRERDLLQRKYETLIAGENDSDIERSFARFVEWDKVAQRETKELDEALSTVMRVNNPLSHWLDDEFKAYRGILGRLCQTFFWDRKRRALPLLTDHELRCLSVREGSLSAQERRDVERHVTHSFEFLKKIPWTRDFALIPQIAYCHHERCDGSGYPRGLKSAEIPLQSRIIAVCDTYDALTSNDRPYQRARSSEDAIQILRAEADAGHLEPALVQIFIDCGVWKTTLNWRKNKKLAAS